MSFGEGNLHDEIDRLKEVNGSLCAEINRQECVIEQQAELIANRDESIHNLVKLLDKRQERVKALESLVRELWEDLVGLQGGYEELGYQTSLPEFSDRMRKLGIEVDAWPN